LTSEVGGDGLNPLGDLDLHFSYKVVHSDFVSFPADYFVKPLNDLADRLELFGVVPVFGVEMLHMARKDLEEIFEFYF
jgi:hypothetical protein